MEEKKRKPNVPRRWGIMREVSGDLNRCLLTYENRQPIDIEKARRQQQSYSHLLSDLGFEITMMPELEGHPDCCFVEDTAVLIGQQKAVICQMGNPARRGEEQGIAGILEKRGMELIRMNGAARADGGDVLFMGHVYYVGLSTRTNWEGFNVIADAARSEGFAACPVEVRGALHLKTIVTRVTPDTVIGIKAYLGEGLEHLEQFDWIQPAISDAAAANVVAIDDTVIVSSKSGELAQLIEKRALKVRQIDISELQKAEAGLTCMAILSA